jgi:hypothetical protein
VFLLVLGTSLIQGLPSLALEVDANSVLAEVGGWVGVVCSVSMTQCLLRSVVGLVWCALSAWLVGVWVGAMHGCIACMCHVCAASVMSKNSFLIV